MGFAGIDLGWLLINLVVLLFSLSIHESAHAWTADRLGDPTGRYLGRVTLNPVAHIDPVGTILFPLIGLITGGIIFGWAKPVPVNTHRLKNPKKDHVFIAGAGPASNLVAAVFFLIGVKLISLFVPEALQPGHALHPVQLLCGSGLLINVILAVFNLIPIPPLDGSWILSGLLPDQLSAVMEAVRPYSFVLLILLLISGTFSMILGPVLGFVTNLAF